MNFISEMTVKFVQKMGTDNIIAGAAWTSTSSSEALRKAEEEIDKVPGLINYLMKMRHGSPFESSYMTVFVHAPIFVWREIHRHRIASYSEESGRYKQLEPVFYIPPEDRPMFKVDDWKPGRPKFTKIEGDVRKSIAYEILCNNLKESYKLSYSKYEENLELGFDPGLARDCLPVGIYSSCWITMNLRSMMNFLSLRIYEPTAKNVSYPLHEIEEVAKKIEKLFKENWPITHKSFVDNGRVAP
jgi:thymidylate synthase (FAD)